MNNKTDPYTAINMSQHYARAGEPCKVCGKPIHDATESFWLDTKGDWVCRFCIEAEINWLQDRIIMLRNQLLEK